MRLYHDTLGGPDARAAIYFLHGILGSGANLRTIARRLVESRPDLCAVLVDLRAHGRSLAHEGPDTVAQAALDVLDLAEELASSRALSAHALVGHSFGGKVVLAMLASERRPATVAHACVLDSTPSARPDRRGSEASVAVLAMLEEHVAGRRFASRAALVEAITSAGHARALAEWLAQSSARDADGGVRFALDLRRIHALLDDYFELDLWSVLERAPAAIHMVVGARSTVLDAADLARLDALASARVTRDDVPAGHWVHVDAPDELLRVLGDRLGRA